MASGNDDPVKKALEAGDLAKAQAALDEMRAADPRSLTLDPNKTLDDWQGGRRWKAVRTLALFALIWLPFAAIFAMVSALVGGFWNFACPGAMLVLMILMTLTLYK